jgi:hypothetical protein
MRFSDRIHSADAGVGSAPPERTSSHCLDVGSVPSTIEMGFQKFVFGFRKDVCTILPRSGGKSRQLNA